MKSQLVGCFNVNIAFMKEYRGYFVVCECESEHQFAAEIY